MCIDFIGVCSVVCMYECNLETLCLTWNGSSAWHMTFFSSFKTFLFPCQAKKATIPTRLTLMIWHKKLFLLNQVWKFNFWREILKSSNNFISMSDEESHYSDKVDIKMKLSFVDFFGVPFLTGNFEIVKLLCISVSVEESHYQWGGTNDLTIDIKWNLDFSFFKSMYYEISY